MENDLYLKMVLTAIAVIQLLQVFNLYLIGKGQNEMWSRIASLERSVSRTTKTKSPVTSLE